MARVCTWCGGGWDGGGAGGLREQRLGALVLHAAGYRLRSQRLAGVVPRRRLCYVTGNNKGTRSVLI